MDGYFSYLFHTILAHSSDDYHLSSNNTTFETPKPRLSNSCIISLSELPLSIFRIMKDLDLKLIKNRRDADMKLKEAIPVRQR